MQPTISLLGQRASATIFCNNLIMDNDRLIVLLSADYAVIVLTAASIERIKKLSIVVCQMKAYRISEFNYEAEFMVADYDADPKNGKVAMKEFEGRMECNTLNVTDTGFYWSGLYKHTDVRWSTDTVPLTALDEAGDFDQREAVSDVQEAL
jgi:hypothetical protein